jgi:hypothetical protein
MPTIHIGRSWSGHFLEDTCPCLKAPCGLVDVDQTDPACPEHPADRGKTIRQSHPASECPGSLVAAPAQHRLMAVSARDIPFAVLEEPREPKACECHTFGQCLTSTGCEECRVFGDESCGLPVDPDEEN